MENLELMENSVFSESIENSGLNGYSVPSKSNITLEVTLENLAQENGHTLSPLWFGFHDGDFNTFDLGSPAPSSIENLAEEGIIGMEDEVPGVIEAAIELGLNPDVLPPIEDTISGQFDVESGEGSTQGRILPETDMGIILPGEIGATDIELEGSIEDNRFLSYGAMFFPSNDAFIADGEPFEIFDEEGNFVGDEITILGNQVYDAGTEINTESPTNVPFDLPEVGIGPEENGVIIPSQGLFPAGSGGVLDYNDGFFSEADIIGTGLPLARITVNPVISGTANQDLLLGENYQERIYGLENDDLIFGGDGDDTIDGGMGNDIIDGNSGADQFVLRLGDGQDTIIGYQDQIDSFALADGLEFEQLTISQGVGEATISITHTNEELAVLSNIDANQLTVEDFSNMS